MDDKTHTVINFDDWDDQEKLEELIRDVEEDKNKAAPKYLGKNPQNVKAILAISRYIKSKLEMMDDLSKGREERAARHKENMEKYYRSIPELYQW